MSSNEQREQLSLEVTHLLMVSGFFHKRAIRRRVQTQTLVIPLPSYSAFSGRRDAQRHEAPTRCRWASLWKPASTFHAQVTAFLLHFSLVHKYSKNETGRTQVDRSATSWCTKHNGTVNDVQMSRQICIFPYTTTTPERKRHQWRNVHLKLIPTPLHQIWEPSSSLTTVDSGAQHQVKQEKQEAGVGGSWKPGRSIMAYCTSLIWDPERPRHCSSAGRSCRSPLQTKHPQSVTRTSASGH